MLRLGLSYDVASLLPHGPAMLLLERLVHYDDDSITCETTIRRDSTFSDGEHGVPAWIGVEYMAQTVAAYAGIERLQAGKPVQMGLLLGTRAYECVTPVFPFGMTLRARAELLARDAAGVGAYACELRDGDALLAHAEIKGYQPEDIEPYLAELDRERSSL